MRWSRRTARTSWIARSASCDQWHRACSSRESKYRGETEMKILILAAGYATRLYPLTLTKPKPLLEVAGKPMIEHVLDNIAPIPGIDRVYVVTNDKFAAPFQQWADHYRATKSKLNF